MRFNLLLFFGAIIFLGRPNVGLSQTVLFDFEDGPQGWGSFGAITTDKGPISGSVGLGQFHAADFSQPDAGNFGIVDVSPFGQNLSAYGGLAVDARFVDVPGFDPFVGVRELDLVVATGDDSNEEEFFAPKQTMTEEYQTFSVPFSEFKSALDQQPPTVAELSNVRIKLVVLNSNGTGTARFDYDQVSGLAPIITDADFDNDSDIDGADFIIWQRNLGGGTTNSQGDANGNGLVNGADLDVWKSTFGMTASATAIPEPCAAVLALSCTSLLTRRRRPAGRDEKVIPA
jgi:hypothetical protein